MIGTTAIITAVRHHDIGRLSSVGVIGDHPFCCAYYCFGAVFTGSAYGAVCCVHCSTVSCHGDSPFNGRKKARKLVRLYGRGDVAVINFSAILSSRI